MIYIGLEDNKTMDIIDPQMKSFDISANDVTFTIVSKRYAYDFTITYYSRLDCFNISKLTYQGSKDIRKTNRFLSHGRYYIRAGSDIVFMKYIDVGQIGLVMG
jgi:Cu2+-containing amine oxidase